MCKVFITSIFCKNIELLKKKKLTFVRIFYFYLSNTTNLSYLLILITWVTLSWWYYEWSYLLSLTYLLSLCYLSWVEFSCKLPYVTVLSFAYCTFELLHLLHFSIVVWSSDRPTITFIDLSSFCACFFLFLILIFKFCKINCLKELI